VNTTSLPRLPDIDEVEPFSDRDQACMSDVRAVLARHGALQRFGLTLLHQHFDIADDEVLVEDIDVANRVLTCRPEKITGAQNAVETSWRLDDPAGMARCRQVCVESPVTWSGHSRRHFA
jgi:hypothetical protein